MNSTADYFRNFLGKRSLATCLLAALAMSTPAATGGEAAPAKKAPVKSSTAAKQSTTSAKPTVLDFGASWCVPCKTFAPIYEKVKANLSTKADFQTVDTETPDGEKLSTKYGVVGLPSLVVVSNGKMVLKKTGKALMDEKALTEEVTKAISK